MAFDAKCFDLAEHFLAGEGATPQHVRQLAQVIQDCIEDWLDFFHEKKEQPE